MTSAAAPDLQEQSTGASFSGEIPATMVSPYRK
jgi:hypothetical protein